MSKKIQILKKGGVKYRLLDYIESNGSQWINTGLKGNEIYGFELDILPKVVKSGSASIYKTYISSGPTLDNFTIGVFRNATGLFYRNRGTAIYQNEGSIVSQFARHKITSLGNTFKVDNTTLATNVAQPLGSLSENIKLLGNYIGDVGEGVAGQVFSYKAYGNNNVLIQDLIPVERVSDNAIGLLDLISGTLYTNAGSGTFTKGNYIKVEHIYKPKYKVKTYEKLEYLESNSSNKQYIKLPQDKLSTQNIKVYADIAVNDLSNDMVILGLRPTDSDTRRQLPDITGDKIYIGANRNIATNKTIDTNRHTHIYDFGHYGQAAYLDDVLIWSGTETLEEWQGTSIRPQYYLFAQNNTGRSGTLPGLFFSGKTYEIKIWSNYVLTYHLIPVKRLKDNAIGMLDTLTNTFYGNAGTGAFTGQSLSTPQYIEEDVEQVDYIQSTGTQYINTLLNLEPSKTIIDTKYEWTTQPSQYDRVFGVMDSSTTQLALTADTTTTQMGTYYAEQGANLGTISLNTPYTLTMKNGQVILNGTSRSVQTKTGTLVNRLILFGLNNNGTITRLSKSKIYYFKITHNGEVIMNLIPVKYGTEYCMLDLVEMKLYHNSGSGAFSGGNIVQKKKRTICFFKNNVKYYPLDYLQSSGTQYINTGVQYSDNISFDLVFKQTRFNTLYHGIIGWNADSGFRYNDANDNVVRCGIKAATWNNTNVSSLDKNTIHYSYNNSTYNGANLNVPKGTSGTPTGSLCLFTYATTIISQQVADIMKVWSFKVYDGATLIRDMIPVERATDNAKGMLDILSGTFYGNSGTGSFLGNKKEIVIVS